MSYFEEYKAGHVVLPHELLSNFHILFTSELDFVVWLFFYENSDVAPSTIASALNRDLVEINTAIKNLQSSGSLKVTILEVAGSVDTIFDANYAFSKLDEIQKAKEKNIPLVLDEKTVSEDQFRDLMQSFEQEMGTITPFQAEEIRNWVEEDDFEIPLIKLALREAVLNRKVSLNYIRAILRNWRGEGIKSESDINRKREERNLADTRNSNLSGPSFHIPTGQWKKN
ncbi:hypothetical protein BG262_02345 [Floricoccus penangensis]|uniref:DnaB/C C-terminal domain-containing protein n=1 Tax=Floricoccus penangensis TaxID=1859475 RepID=A0A9Q5JGR6_9LACT|nr:DnaD domain-containing protein [Floricoccus penangensis]OFI46662.1 hypothetical protein BG262_02345 [Floricoccus penangensis]